MGSARGKGDCNFPLVPMASDKIIVFQAGACKVSATSAASGDEDEGRGGEREAVVSESETGERGRERGEREACRQ